jgi:hypothetical protein
MLHQAHLDREDPQGTSQALYKAYTIFLDPQESQDQLGKNLTQKLIRLFSDQTESQAFQLNPSHSYQEKQEVNFTRRTLLTIIRFQSQETKDQTVSFVNFHKTLPQFLVNFDLDYVNFL